MCYLGLMVSSIKDLSVGTRQLLKGKKVKKPRIQIQILKWTKEESKKGNFQSIKKILSHMFTYWFSNEPIQKYLLRFRYIKNAK